MSTRVSESWTNFSMNELLLVQVRLSFKEDTQLEAQVGNLEQRL